MLVYYATDATVTSPTVSLAEQIHMHIMIIWELPLCILTIASCWAPTIWIVA